MLQKWQRCIVKIDNEMYWMSDELAEKSREKILESFSALPDPIANREDALNRLSQRLKEIRGKHNNQDCCECSSQTTAIHPESNS